MNLNATSNSSLRRNPGIDLLRGIAIFLVVVHHTGLRIPLKEGILAQYLPAWVLTTLNWRGYQAVFIFFVLSGFLIAGNSIQRWQKLNSIRPGSFYLRRAARILPCFLLLLAVLSGLHLLGLQDYMIRLPGQTLPHALFSALGLHLNWYEGLTGYLPANWDVLWSLSVEEVFYLAFPVVCLLLRWDWMLAPLLGCTAAALPWFLTHTGGSDIWQEKAYLPGIAAIALGVLGAMATRWIPKASKWVVYTLLTTGAAAVFGALCLTHYVWLVFRGSTLLVLTVGTLLLVLGFHWQARNGAAWRLRGTGWLQNCGRMSYEIYLSHMFVVLPVYRLTRQLEISAWWGCLWYPPILAACWVLGWAVTRWISRPADRWIVARFGKLKPAPEVC